MLDLELVFFVSQDISAAITSDAIDLEQAFPDSGSYGRPPLAVVVTGIDGTTSIEAGGSFELTVQDSEDGETFADVASYAFSEDLLAAPLVAPMPVRHKRYVRVVTAPTLITGKSETSGYAFLTNEYPLARRTPFYTFEVQPTID